MANQPWTRRRVQALPMLRATDGSAYEKCLECGVSVVIALFDMHIYECKARKQHKRSRDLDFRKCGHCGMLVEITIYDTHKCADNHDDGDQDVSGKRQKSTSEQCKPDTGNGESLGDGKCMSKNPSKVPLSSDKCQLDTRNLPRSAFRFFMESFEKTCHGDDWFEVDTKGFQKWKDMTVEEKYPYEIEATRVEKAYTRILKREMEELASVQVLSQANCLDGSSVRQLYKRQRFR